MLARVKVTRNPTAILLESTVNLMFGLYLIRGDCSYAAKALMAQKRLDELALEDCALLDDSLAKSFKLLQSTVRRIQARRGQRKRRKA